MKIDMKVDMSGFRELERALSEDLPKATAKNVLKRSATAAMKRIEDRAKQLAPRNTGETADSITTKNVAAKRVSRTRYARSTGVTVATGPTGHPAGGKAAFSEFGTVKSPAQPYMRPAADAEGQAVIKDVKEALTDQVDKAKKRIARKMAKAAKAR